MELLSRRLDINRIAVVSGPGKYSAPMALRILEVWALKQLQHIRFSDYAQS
jgi:hypothetical protein